MQELNASFLHASEAFRSKFQQFKVKQIGEELIK